MSGFDDLVSAIEAATGRSGRRSGKNVRLLCPAHDDHNPSLDVAEGDDGAPLVVCRSHGCTYEQVCEALGREPREFLPERHDTNGDGEWTPFGPAVAVYHYTDEGGRPAYDVCRTRDKQFPVRRPDPTAAHGWRWKLGDTRRVLYRLPEVIAAVAAGKTVYVCEGEKDVEALRAHGVVATCNPGGAKKWRAEYSTFLRGAKAIIVADRDEEGSEHARLVAESLRQVNAKVWIVQARTGKDAYDHLAAGHELREFVRMEDSGSPAAGFALRLGEFVSVEEDDPSPLLGSDGDAIVPVGGLVIVAGRPGIGKTTFVLDGIFHLATGRDWLEIPCPRPLNILIVENEGPARMFRQKLQAKRECWQDPPDDRVWIQTWRWGSFNLADDEARLRLRSFLDEREIDLVVGDPLGTLGMSGVGSPEDTRNFTAFLVELGLFGQRSFLFLHHFRKEPTPDELDQISGAWGGHLDTLLVLKATQRSSEIRLSFPKTRWAMEQRKPLILGKVTATQSFEVLGEEGDPGLLEPLIIDLLADGLPRTLDEIASGKRGGIGHGKPQVKTCLEQNDHIFVQLTKDEAKAAGRSTTAVLWKVARGSQTSQATSEESLQSARMESTPDPYPPIGGSGEGSNQTLNLGDEEFDWR